MILKRHQATVSIIEQADWISKESPKRLPKRLLTHFA